MPRRHCQVLYCTTTGQFLQHVPDGKLPNGEMRRILMWVCAKHERFYGRMNLKAAGLTAEEIVVEMKRNE